MLLPAPMIVERSMDPAWLSNAYLVADEPRGKAVFVDSGAPLEPLVDAVYRLEVEVTHVLTTHAHTDHVAHHADLVERFDAEVLGFQNLRDGAVVEAGGLRIEALHTPGHSPDMVAFVVNGETCFAGGTLFAGSVGGTVDGFDELRRSVMDVLMELPARMRVLPGHAGATTIGREWAENPFVAVWRGSEPEGTERCIAAGEEATLVVWSPDYDGGGKAWVRFMNGRDAILGGSRVRRQ